MPRSSTKLEDLKDRDIDWADKRITWNSKYFTDRTPATATVAGEPRGALNANWSDVDAAVNMANCLGEHGLVYNQDFFFDGSGSDSVSFVFNTESLAAQALIILTKIEIDK